MYINNVFVKYLIYFLCLLMRQCFVNKQCWTVDDSSHQLNTGWCSVGTEICLTIIHFSQTLETAVYVKTSGSPAIIGKKKEKIKKWLYSLLH